MGPVICLRKSLHLVAMAVLLGCDYSAAGSSNWDCRIGKGVCDYMNLILVPVQVVDSCLLDYSSSIQEVEVSLSSVSTPSTI